MYEERDGREGKFRVKSVDTLDSGYRSARKGKLAEVIAELIKEDIVRRGWPVGEALGNQKQLQEHYEVSKATIREAICQLERHGVASMRRGPHGGLVVQQPARISSVLALVTYLELTGITFDELFEARDVIEGMAVDQAVEKFPNKEIEKAREFISELNNTKLRDFSEEILLHTQIRSFLSEICENPATVLILQTLYHVTINITPPNISKTVLKAALWEARKIRARILEAIIDGDSDSARQAMRDMLSTARWLTNEQIENQKEKHGSPLVLMQQTHGGLPYNIYDKYAHKIALTISNSIAVSRLKSGQHLGTEVELQKRYDVSRSVLREALRILELHSIVVSKRGYGGGLIVGNPCPDYTVSVVTSYLQYCDYSVDHFYDVYKVILPATVKLASSRADEEGREKILALLNMTKSVSRKHYWASVRELELVISEAGGNRALALFSRVMIGMAGKYSTKIQPPEVVERLSLQHEKIVNAILAREGGIARRETIQYLKDITAWFGPEVKRNWLSKIRREKKS